MGTTAEKFNYAFGTKDLLKTEINKINNVLDDNSTFRSYPQELFNGYLDVLNNGTDTLWNNLEKVSQSGTEAVLEGVETAPMKVELQGNTQQNGEPTPDTPIPVQVVTGENVVSVSGKNLFDKDNQAKIQVNAEGTLRYGIIVNAPNKKVSISGKNWSGYIAYKPLTNGVYGQWVNTNQDTTINVTDKLIIYSNGDTIKLDTYVDDLQIEISDIPTSYVPYSKTDYPINLVSKNLLTGTFRQGNALGEVINKRLFADDNYYVEKGKTYILSTNLDVSQFNYALNISGNNFPTSAIFDSKWLTLNQYIFTAKMSGHIGIPVRKADDSALTPTDIQDVWFKLEETIYGEETSLELCKINTYKDYFHKDSGKWYVHKEIGKVVLDGSESWNYIGTRNNRNVFQWNDGPSNKYNVSNTPLFCDKFTQCTIKETDDYSVDEGIANGGKYYSIKIITKQVNTLTDFKTWLSTNKPIVYYVLATPTEEEITNSTLIEQLEAISKAKSVKNKTYITQTNDDLPFILDVEAIKEYEVN